jgi:hypothetical protein
MDGKQLCRMMLDALDEETANKLFNTNDRILYGELDWAACEYVRQLKCLHAACTITTVEAQQAYDLPPDFLGLYMRNSRDRHFIKYYDGSSTFWPVIRPYESIFMENLTDNADVPGSAAIIEKATAPVKLTGTTTSAGAKTNGEAILINTSALFTTTGLVYPRDIVHNVTDGSDGIVLSVIDATHLVAALFDGKTNAFGSGDTYVITRANARQLYLCAPSDTAGHTITVPYLCMPNPVYSDYGRWRFDDVACRAIAHEAAFQYENRKHDFNGADRHHILFLAELTRSRQERAALAIQGGRYRNLP